MQSQIHELGFFFWEGNFGDVGPTTYVAPNELWYTLQMEQKSKTFVACILYTVYNHIK
jgi:hypothetical protein